MTARIAFLMKWRFYLFFYLPTESDCCTLSVAHRVLVQEELLRIAHTHREVLRPGVVSQALLRIAKVRVTRLTLRIILASTRLPRAR